LIIETFAESLRAFVPFIIDTLIDNDEDMASEAQDIFPYIWMDQAAYAIADLNPPWAVRIEATRRHWIYRVRRGSCVFESLRAEPQTTYLEKDDIIGVTNDLPHTFRATPNVSIPKKPHGFELRPAGAPESDAAMSILIGWVPYGIEPLITLFPSVFNVKADGSIHSQRLLRLLDLAELEIVTEPRAPGSPSVLRRLSEVVVVELLRFTTEQMSGDDRGDVPAWISGLADPLVSRVAAKLHSAPGDRWTVEAMCRIAGLSRSALDNRFRAVFGQAPKRYLLELRMRRAATALAAGRQTIGEIASWSGYESEAAFNRAFHRAIGVTPGVYRSVVYGEGKTTSTRAR
jgi:AraC-like DNA-binding protein